jgi:hypothetical protein
MRLLILGLGFAVAAGAVAAETSGRVTVPQVNGAKEDASTASASNAKERATAVPQVNPAGKTAHARPKDLVVAAPVGGKDRCSEEGAPDSLCSQTLEKRAADFPAPGSPKISAEARLLVLSEPSTRPASGAGANGNLADPDVVAGAAAAQVGRALEGADSPAGAVLARPAVPGGFTR